MGFLDRLLGREPLSSSRTGAPAPRDGSLPPPSGQPYAVPAPSGGASEEDERAIARYKYLLRTAPPEAIEQVHREAFEKLTQEQRQQVLQRMSADLPEAERPTRADPAELARAATRAEMRQPGYLPQAFGGGGMGMGRGGMGMGGMGMGGMFAGSMLGTIAGVVVGSAIADAMMGGFDDSPEAAAAADTGDPAGDSGDSGADTGADTGADSGVDYAGDGGGDLGSDFGGGFGDFGGGDFGGDFGGGDF
ncbi:MAG TPA: hypothetical protein VFJ94_12340 [Intrasporangium sp.]|uniref:hypothetical protein n=1 Tax=Intrasporangium sp. TaxID=1925024 RepID=UPI002D790E7C|nr:hypothetical protein [Intrasporangium sp.]HET7399298.1 hypothetical protein [Intrasporangium sp.]